MPTLGQGFMYAALVCGILAVVLLVTGYVGGRKKASSADKFTNAGYLGIFAVTFFLTLAIALLVYCFFAGDYTIAYVAKNHSVSTSSLAWLYTLSGVWAGSQGSLLLWAWLLSLFASFVAWKRMTVTDELTNVALAVMGTVLVAFICVLTFSSTNNPFIATGSNYLDADGNLIGTATGWGMNVLLEHWAMAIHPITLFVGYAGLTVPFVYAVAALVVNDPSKRWVEFCDRITVFAWLFLGIGIGLGAVWAYVVLGWGGYWGWDAVENASLLPWLVGVALLHSFTLYRKRNGFKRWAVFCACLTFSFVILGTFITRSGIVQSVHAFAGDNVSLVFFLVLIFVSLLIGIVGIIIRRKSFEASEEIVSFTGKNTAYYFGNLVMVVMAFVITYLTLTSAMPSWMPFGGESMSTATYDTLVRPIGVVFCLLMAVCPILAWNKTDGREFRKNAKVPAIFALIGFVGLMVIYFVRLYPNYAATIAGKGSQASKLLAMGPSWYYNGLAILALLVASLLFFNTLFLFINGVKARKANKGEKTGVAFLHLFTKSAAQAGGYLTHLGVAIILIGLVGSSMFVREVSVNINPDAGSTIDCMEYTLEYVGTDTTETSTGGVSTATFKVYRNGEYLEEVSPSMVSITSTGESKLNAAVISYPLEDLFVVYQGVSTSGTLSMIVRVNPLISWVWVGFVVMMLGTLIAAVGSHKRKKTALPAESASPVEGGDGNASDDSLLDPTMNGVATEAATAEASVTGAAAPESATSSAPKEN